MRRFCLAGVLFLTASGCRRASSGEGSFLVEGVNALSFDAQTIALADGVLVAVQGNADMRVLDLASGRATVVPRAQFETTGAGYVSYRLHESLEGRDLNGDGDLEDSVWHVLHARRGEARNLRLAMFDPVAHPIAQHGTRMAGVVSEQEQGADLDGNGRFDDRIAVVYEAALGRQTVLRVPVEGPRPFHLSARYLVYPGSERDAGVDLNGDGDSDDAVTQAYEFETGTLRNVRLAADQLFLAGDLLGARVWEFENGGADLNGSGTEDFFSPIHDLATGRARIPPLAESEVAAIHEDGALLIGRSAVSDLTYTYYDFLTDSFLPVEGTSRIEHVVLADRRAAFPVEEWKVDLDLDGDGDVEDSVLHVFDARSGRITSSGRAMVGSALGIHAGQVVFLGVADAASPRPPMPLSVHVLDLRSGRIADLGLMASEMRYEDGRVLALTPEAWQGVDLNGDRDLDDTVLQVYDLATGNTLNTKVVLGSLDTSTPLELDGNLLVVASDESPRNLLVFRL